MKIAFFAFESRDLNTFPSIVNAIRLLAREGHSVDVYLPSPMSTKIVVDGCQFFIVSDSYQYKYVINTIKIVSNHGIAYDYFFAYYIEGLIVSEVLSNKSTSRVPIIYFSMELIYKNYSYRMIRSVLTPKNLLAGLRRSIMQAIRKTDFHHATVRQLVSAYLKESAYAMLALRSWVRLSYSGRKKILFSVISDHMRGMELKKEFPFVDKIVYAPEAGYIGYNDEKSDYAVKNFGISPHKKILLYTGGLERGFDLSLLDVSKKLGDDYILFCNVYSRDGYVKEILSEYSREIEDGRLFFQTLNLNESEYDDLVRSAYIGIVWYPHPNPENPNMYYMGFSSGKMNKFLSCGKPVISRSSIYGYREMIESNGLGRVCLNACEIPLAVVEIDKYYRLIVKNIRPFYLEHVEFERFFQNVIEMIKRI